MLRKGACAVVIVGLLVMSACGSGAAASQRRAIGPETIASDAPARELVPPVVNVADHPPDDPPARLREQAERNSPQLAPARSRRRAAAYSYDETPLADVIDDIAQRAGVNIVVNWRSLANHNITRKSPVSIELTGVSARSALKVLTDDLSGGRGTLGSVYWLVEDGMVRIATGDALNTALTTHTFDIGDLVMVIPDFPGPRLDLAASGDIFGESDDGDEEGPGRKEMEDNLIELIKGTIDADMWRPTGKGSVSIFRDQVIISQTKLGWMLIAGR